MVRLPKNGLGGALIVSEKTTVRNKNSQAARGVDGIGLNQARHRLLFNAKVQRDNAKGLFDIDGHE
jgi:hypothetical protein